MTLSNIDQYLTIPAVPTIPASLPPSGPAGGDLTSTYPNPTLVATGPGATGPIGSTTTTPVITIDAKGRVTALTSATISVTPGNLTGPITSVGLATSIASQTGTGTKFVVDTSPTLITPNIGTPSAGVLTNCTGTAAGLTAGNVTTNANMTGVITSVGNATSIAAQTGTGTTFVVDSTPTLATPVLKLPTIVDSTDATKRVAWTISNQTTSTTVTINTGAQTVNRILNIPILGGTDTVATLGVANTFSNTITIANRLRSSAALTSVDVGTGVTSIYRVGGTLQPIGSLILQSDVGQATSGVAVYVGNGPTVGLTAFTSAASIGTIASTYTGVVIAGVQTSLAAIAGQVREVLTGTPQTTYTNFTTTATFQNLTGTLALTPGDWLITAIMTFSSNGATLGNSAQMGLSSTTAAQTGSTPLNVEGLSIFYIPAGLFTTLSVFQTETVSIRYQVSAATNVFFVGKASFSVGNPQFVASITATRVG